MKTKIFLIIVIVLLIFTAGCDFKTIVDYDRSADFSSIQTYAWFVERDNRINDLTHRRIIDSVNEQLVLKGLKEVENNPDVYVTYFGDDNEQVVVDTTHYGYGYGRSWYWDPYWGGGMSTSTSRVRTYKEGTLVVDIYLAGPKELIWRGAITGTITDNPEKNVNNFKKALSKLFKKYPPEPES
jgi:hypothetical protein